jgi:drug/metabolite transporter (DMT)-like permease
VHDDTVSRGAAGRASLLIALSACGFASIAIFVTFATAAGAPLLGVLAWRYIVASAVLVAIAWMSGVRVAGPGAARAILLLGFIQSLIAALSLSALRFIPVGTLAFLFYTYPAWVAIIARVRHSEPLTRTRLLALALSLGGIVVMVGSPGTASLHAGGVALALISALLYAAYIPLMDAMQRGRSPITISTYVAVGASLFLGLAAAARGELSVQMPATAWWSILSLALISTVAAFLMFMHGLGVLGPVRTAIISTIEPFFTALLGAWLLGQGLTKVTLLGGAFIATAVALLQVRPAERSGRQGRPTAPTIW